MDKIEQAIIQNIRSALENAREIKAPANYHGVHHKLVYLDDQEIDFLLKFAGDTRGNPRWAVIVKNLEEAKHRPLVTISQDDNGREVYLHYNHITHLANRLPFVA